MFSFTKTADSIVAKFTKVIAELEDHARAKEDEIERHIANYLHYQQLKDFAEVERLKAQAFANKLKALFN